MVTSILRKYEERLFPDFNLAKAEVSKHGVDYQTFLVQKLETSTLLKNNILQKSFYQTQIKLS